jgi:hypothetical protein
VAFKEKKFQGCWLWSLPQRAPQDAVDGRSPAKSQRSKVKKIILRGGEEVDKQQNIAGGGVLNAGFPIAASTEVWLA